MANHFYKPQKEEIKSELPGGLREDDTRVKLFDPQLRAAGWGEENIRRHFYITKGKVIIEGDKTKRGERKFFIQILIKQVASQFKRQFCRGQRYIIQRKV